MIRIKYIYKYDTINLGCLSWYMGIAKSNSLRKVTPSQSLCVSLHCTCIHRGFCRDRWSWATHTDLYS